MKRAEGILKGVVLALSHAMCAVVAWNYCSLLWAGRYAGASAPAYIAFLSAIPFALGIAVCLLLIHFVRRRKSS